MPRKTRAIYEVITTYGMHRDVIFTLNNETGKNYIQVVNTRTGEYHQIPYKQEYNNSFIRQCEAFIVQHFGKHLNCFTRIMYQEVD